MFSHWKKICQESRQDSYTNSKVTHKEEHNFRWLINSEALTFQTLIGDTFPKLATAQSHGENKYCG